MKLARLEGRPEIFYTLQGEGKSLGQPSVFIRTSLCNLHCIWCDTDYTWNWEGTRFEHLYDQQPGYTKYKKSEWIEEISVKDTAELLESYDCKNIVLTGGEPMLQQDELVALCRLLKEKDGRYKIEIETNGTLLPGKDFDRYIDQYNVSPKLSNSNNPEKLRLKPDVLDFFSKSDKAFFKFVIDTETDLAEVQQVISRHSIRKEHVYLMPQGVTPAQLHEKRKWLVEICKAHKYNYTDRLHIHIWGSKRGV